MNKYFFILIFSITAYGANAQCLVSSLIINTGYDPVSGLAIPGGANGAAPVPDPHWIVTSESPGIAIAIVGPGYTEVVPGNSADIVTPAVGWTTNPIGNPGGWIGCLNSNIYTTDGTGPSGTAYNTMLSRPFRICSDDSIKLDLYIANDNYISSMDVDGTLLAFSQPPLPTVTNYSTFTHFTQTIHLAAGTHTLNVLSNNYNVTTVALNAAGIDIYGTVSSASLTTSLVAESIPGCATYVCTAACDAISLPDTINACQGTVITLPATLIGTDSVLSILWSPATGLSTTTLLTPALTVGTVSSYYYLTVQSLFPVNLVVNGDFSAGNTGFTSSYGYVTGPGSLVPEGVYTITTDPFLEHPGAVSFGDHTTGTGNMMAINGANTPISVWCETIPVTPNTNYDFSAWMANWSAADVGTGAPILQFQINGTLIGTPFTITAAPGVWVNFFQVWNSGINTTAAICIYDLNTVPGGNDFALDDISFKPICVATDSVFVAVSAPDTTTASKDTTLCVTAAPILLNAVPGYTSYLWNTGATGTFIPAPVSGTYWVQNNNTCATLVDTFHVNYIPVPTISLGPDTAFCIGNTLVLSSVQPPGSAYLWSDGTSGTSISVSTSGSYWLQVSNGFCIAADTIHVTISPPPLVDLGPDTLNCTASPITLQSSFTYTAPNYLWSDGSITPSIVASVTGTYWLQVTDAGCAGADTVNVTILYDTFSLANHDTAICFGQEVPVFLNVNPAATCQWLPTAGIAISTIPSPAIGPDTSAEYRVTISLAGCPDIVDSFYIDVQPNPSVFAGGNKMVCQYDTLHFNSFVNPAWYTHYTYSWSPSTFLDDPTMPTVVFTAGTNTEYVLTVTTPAGCHSNDSVYVTVHPGDFAKLDTTFGICPHDSVQLIPSGGVSYIWHPGLYLSDSTSSAPWSHAITSLAYTAIATSSFGCLDTVYTNVVIHPSAVIYLGDSVTLYPGESYQISPQTNCVNFTWFPAAGLNNDHVSDPVATPLISTKYIVNASTEWGCKAEDSISIYFDQSSLLAIPNAFTPGAGINNKLFIIRRGEATLNYYRIYNRWGNLVFETSDIDEGWDGTYKGKPQPFDVYVYEIEAETSVGSVFHKHGNVTLIR